MAAYEDFQFFRAASAPPAARQRGEPSPSRDALRGELERLHVELRRMRKTLHRRTRWRDRLRRLMLSIVPRNAPSRRMRQSA